MTGWVPVLLVVTCALGWVGLDLTRKLLADHGRAVPITTFMVAGQIPLFVVWVAVGGSGPIGSGYWLPGLAVAALNLLANLAFMQSVKLAPLSTTLPLLSLTPVFASLLAVPILGELPTPTQWAGIVLVVVGALALAWGGRPRDGDGFDLKGLLGSGGLLMTIVALCWSVTPALDKIAMRHAGPSLHALLVVVGVTVGLLAQLGAQGRLPELGSLARNRPALGLLVASVVLGGLASALQLLAIQRVPVGLVETVKRGVGALGALALGRWLLKEDVEAGHVGAVSAMVVGVALVILG
ncbi:MAG: EamA family transporter [Acidobacteriota bacterium]